MKLGEEKKEALLLNLLYLIDMSDEIKILICDDHKIVRDGLKQILVQMPEISLIEEAENGIVAESKMKHDFFDIVILDISLPGASGIEILQVIKSKWSKTKVIILSMMPQEQYARRAFKLGASAYLTKNTASEELLSAIRKVSQGGIYISQELAETIALELNVNKQFDLIHESLSEREFEIMIKLANGIKPKEIGVELNISHKTVSSYRGRIMEKMDMLKNTELTKYCLQYGLI